MEIVRSFKKVERSYHSTENGWRLATFEEAKNGLERNIVQQHLKEWERVRLLDGWISGSGYGYEIKNEFRGCMGYMLLIQTQPSAEDESGTPYADVHLSELGKEVALFLCVDDWNYEVVYWLLNSWSKSDTMNVNDVRGGNIPLLDAEAFQEMNEGIGRLARRLAEEKVAASGKWRTTTYSGEDSVSEVLRGMIQIAKEEAAISDNRMPDFRGYGGDKYSFPHSLGMGDVAGDFWSFVCETFAGHIVELRAYYSLKNMLSMETKGNSEKNLKMATFILLYLSDYRSDIIHEPLAHYCLGNCGGKVLKYAEDKAGGNAGKFSEMLKHNAMWKCYDETGNYGVLNKLLFAVTQGKHARIGGLMAFFFNYKRTGCKNTSSTVKTLLKCGAQPTACYAIGNYRKKTTLHNVVEFLDKNTSTNVLQQLIGSCDKKSRSDFVNAEDDNGRTALHIASKRGNAELCKLLAENFKASVKIQDQEGMTPLHYALEAGFEVVDVFMGKEVQVADSIDLKDQRGYTPLDIAIKKGDYSLIVKLLSESEKPEAYLSKVDQKRLLCSTLRVNSVDIFHKLYEQKIKLPAGACDEDGKPALHLGAMYDDEKNAIDIVNIIMEETQGQDENIMTERDRRGRTVLHEAALKGHEKLCEKLLRKKPELINMKDRDGRNALYDAVKGKHKQLLKILVEKEMPGEDLIDRSGLTPLHVAVSQGNVDFVKILLDNNRFKEIYLSRGDFLGQTALHKAAKRGDIETVKILLEHGAHPLRERDCDGRTALHYAVQAETGDKQELAKALFQQCKLKEEKALLSWASAAGLGTADQNLSKGDPLCKFLVHQKQSTFEVEKDISLLRMAASVGDIEMTKELIIRGYQIEDIQDNDWRSSLDRASEVNVTKVLKQFKMIKEQGNDKPAISDSLGRSDYAKGLAALFMNPYIKPPIAVGITGTWGMGKSSLMIQTQQILLTTAAQMALLESANVRNSTSELPGIDSYKLSRKGKRKCGDIYRQIKREKSSKNLTGEEIQKELEKFLNDDDIQYRKVFKSLAAMDSSDMFETKTPRPKADQTANAPGPKADQSAEESVPAVLTVQYNAWKYRNDTEALAGMAVEITKELEGIMTQAQWLSTCCRYTWRKKKYTLWIEIFFPSILALVLVGSLTWIAWVVFDSDKFKQWAKAKYGWLPAAMVIIVWTLTKSVMGIVKPVSTQLMQYISFPDHTDKLGYQEKVISDITFLKDEIGRRAFCLFIVFSWVLTAFKELWHLISESCVTSMLFHHRSLEKAIETPIVTPASGSNLRIIVFVDDLDRCQESVILQVLSAINIVLAECEINVVMGMDKRLLQRAIMKKFGDGKIDKSLKTSQELADMYLQKIIQLPLDLPDPSEEQSRNFLKGQLGVLENGDKAHDSTSQGESDDEVSSRGYGEQKGEQKNVSAAEPGNEETETIPRHNEPERQHASAQVSINMQSESERAQTGEIERTDDRSSSMDDRELNVQSVSEKKFLEFLKFPVRKIAHAFQFLRKGKTETEIIEATETGRQALSQTQEDKFSHELTCNRQNSSSSILIRKILFVRYSQGEENAFLHFQTLTTGSRKLPREWKRLLNYHRLVWYIFSVSEDAKTLAGWQVQLITWIFVCWEWLENMNLVIEKWKGIKWNEISGLKYSESNEPSLLMIVEHLMEEHERENPKMTATGNEEDKSKGTGNLGEAGGSVGKVYNKEKLSENIDDNEKMEKHNSQNKFDAFEKSLAELKKEVKKLKEPASDELKEDMEELIKQMSNDLKEQMKELKRESDELKEEMKELKKQVSDELKKDINEIKEQIVKKHNNKNGQIMENKKNKLHNLENWKRMKSTLQRYDVQMEGIQAFQRFRLYCIPGYLPRPHLKDQ